jgi:uncharacterized protein YcbK (DUF882 family)
VTGQTKHFGHKWVRRFLATLVFALTFLPGTGVAPLSAASGERTLYLYYTQLNETKRITFRRNGRYDQSGLRELNAFLRDWRRNEPTEMDPALFDLVWQIYQDVGASGPIYVVSAYRSPQTNEMLRSRSRAVAKNSRHTMGMAMDFYIPGISVAKLREAAMRRQVGGVGYYPTSGNPFVHLDTGNVRAWPRMTRAQLKRLFPDGRTLHLPTDGVPLSQEGRRYASNEWEKCGSVPCIGSNSNIAPSRGGPNNSGGSGRTLLDLFFGGGNQPEPVAQVADASPHTPSQDTPSQRTVTSVPIIAPVPVARAAFLDYRGSETPPIPASMPQSLLVAMRNPSPNGDETALPAPGIDPIVVASIGEPDRPLPSLLLSRNEEQSSLAIAYAPTGPEPDAQRALQMLIERRNSTDALIANNPLPPDSHNNQTGLSTPAPVLRGSITTASLSPAPQISMDQAAGLFKGTWDAIILAQPRQEMSMPGAGIAPNRLVPLALTMRSVELFAPDLAHVSQSMVMPVAMSEAPFAIMFEPDQGDFSPATELGAMSGQIYFTLEQSGNLASNRFTAQTPFIVSAL